MKENNNGFLKQQAQKNENQELTTPQAVVQNEQTLENISHEALVGMIKQTLEIGRAHWEKKYGKGTFDPVEYLGNHLELSVLPANRRGKEAQKQLRLLSLAYDTISEGQLKSQEFRGRVRMGLEAGSRTYGRYIRLEPKAVKLLDAMAEAVAIPRTRGEATIDLLQNFPPELQEETGISPAKRKAQWNFRSLFWQFVNDILLPPYKDARGETDGRSLTRLFSQYFQEPDEKNGSDKSPEA